MLALHCLEVLTLIVFDESNRVAAQQLIVHPKRGVGDFPTTSSAHLDNILPTMIRTVKISHRSKILGYCIFLALVLVGDDRNFGRIDAWM